MTTQMADTTSVTLTFDDFYLLTAEDIDAFAVNWTEHPTPPPYNVIVDGKKFVHTGTTYLVRGFGAELPRWVKEQEAEGHLVLFVERDDRLLSYVYDPAVAAEEAAEAAEAAAE
jgi:hypothetical protein